MLRTFTAFFILLATNLMAQTPRVVVDSPALHSLVSMVMGDTGTPDLLLPRGSDPHEFQMRPSQVQALGRADILFWVGPAQTPWLPRAIEEMMLSDRMETMNKIDGTYLRYYCVSGVFDCVDPHAWLHPDNARLWLDVIAARLTAIDAPNADIYLANAAIGKEAIAQTTQTIEAQLAASPPSPIIVLHDGYEYFAERFGMTILGAIKVGEIAPAAAHLRNIRQIISAQNSVCVFGENGHDMALVNTVTDGTKAHTGTLDLIGDKLEYGAQYYPALLHGIADTISNCAGK